MKKNLYLCGPTVYDTPHVGNLRPIISFDIFIRANLFLGNKINFIHNVTDIDDKIVDRAFKEKTTEKKISHKYTTQYKKLLVFYNVLKPNHMPKVTKNINLIIKFIKSLLKKNLVYNHNGNIYFSVNSFKNYGNISNQDVNKVNLQKNQNKKNLLDFVIWKKTTKGTNFKSPWSKGRPGWHTECSALVYKYLKGNSLDVHGAGIDLIFPHNENENAQYETLTSNPITKVWKHIGKVEFNDQKMSKSTGNVLTAFEFLEKYDSETLRMIFLTSNPTTPINLSKELILQNQKLKNKFKKVFLNSQLEKKSNVNVKKIATKLANWNWSSALKLINQEIKTFNINKSNSSNIIAIMKLLGMNFSKLKLNNQDKKNYQNWITLRKKEKFQKADLLRKELVKKGIL